jgi:hypothetical protein
MLRPDREHWLGLIDFVLDFLDHPTKGAITMNVFLNFSKMFSLIPYLIMGIEQFHSDLPGASKKQLAMEALGLAANTAATLAPGKQEEIGAATQLASTGIDAFVATANQLGIFKKSISKTPVPAPAHVPTTFVAR